MSTALGQAVFMAFVKIFEKLLRAVESLKPKREKWISFHIWASEKRKTDQTEETTMYEADDDIRELAFALDYASRSKARSIKAIFRRFFAIDDDQCLGGGDVNKIKSLELHGIKKTTIVEGVNLNPANEQLHLPDHRCSLLGSKDEVEKLVSILVDKEHDQSCPIICICGMAGLGKTTLSKKVYNNPEVRSHFEGFAWAKVAQNFRTRSILEDIFLQLVPESEEEIMKFSTLELVQQLFEVQLSKKFLIVLDDVWSKDAWECLNLAFPSKKAASKLVVTTKCREVAEEIADKGIAYTMRTSTKDDRWELFVEKAFSGGDSGVLAFNGYRDLPYHLDFFPGISIIKLRHIAIGLIQLNIENSRIKIIAECYLDEPVNGYTGHLSVGNFVEGNINLGIADLLNVVRHFPCLSELSSLPLSVDPWHLLSSDAFLGKQIVFSLSALPGLLKLKALPNKCKIREQFPGESNHLKGPRNFNLEPDLERRGESSELWDVHSHKSNS